MLKFILNVPSTKILRAWNTVLWRLGIHKHVLLVQNSSIVNRRNDDVPQIGGDPREWFSELATVPWRVETYAFGYYLISASQPADLVTYLLAASR